MCCPAKDSYAQDPDCCEQGIEPRYVGHELWEVATPSKERCGQL